MGEILLKTIFSLSYRHVELFLLFSSIEIPHHDLCLTRSTESEPLPYLFALQPYVSLSRGH